METEITVQVFDDFEKIDKTLKQQGFANVGSFKIKDWYFSKQDNVLNLSYEELMKDSFLVRETAGEKQGFQLIYKKKNINEYGVVVGEEKVKTQLSDSKEAIDVFCLAGINNYCCVENDSYIYSKDEFSLIVQKIKNLGVFIEFEEFDAIKDLDEIQKIDYLTNIIKSLGLNLGTDFSCKKVFMLLHS